MTARDIRYGRRGGTWLVERSGPDVCATCRNGTARFRACHKQTGERWRVCARCRRQGQKYGAPISYTPIDEQKEAS